MQNWLKRKDIDVQGEPGRNRLAPTLSWWHLVALGVGGVVGTGIYTLVGVGANLAGPAVILSFLVAGIICTCAALAYAEVAAMIPASGSAYTYSYVALGEIFAWVVGWSLILEYSLVVSAVAVGWSGYASGFLAGLGMPLPPALVAGPYAGGLLNLPAIVIIAVVAGLLSVGTRESATLNAGLVVVKLAALLVFMAVAAPHFHLSAFQPFMPYGFAGHSANGVPQGVMAAAAIIFFAFYGFDAISTASEEAKNPGRDLPIGIIGSLAICTLIYIGVAAFAVGSMPFTEYAHSAEPLALILRKLGAGNAAVAIGAAAIIALPTVILAFLFGQSRIFFVMARDGLLPRELATINTRTGTPVRITWVTAILVGVLAGLIPLDQIAALANAGTLLAFMAVALCMLILRRRAPKLCRPFRTRAPWLVGSMAILGCFYLFLSLPSRTQIFFGCWNLVGLTIYSVVRNFSSEPDGKNLPG
ncbi:MAG TPA: amino acid permease [Rhizomicrobium sp.]|nr:amino acid permease [Rhizomicrobium sp.]